MPLLSILSLLLLVQPLGVGQSLVWLLIYPFCTKKPGLTQDFEHWTHLGRTRLQTHFTLRKCPGLILGVKGSQNNNLGRRLLHDLGPTQSSNLVNTRVGLLSQRNRDIFWEPFYTEVQSGIFRWCKGGITKQNPFLYYGINHYFSTHNYVP